MVLNGDLTAFGRNSQWTRFRDFYENPASNPIPRTFLGLGNHDLTNPALDCTDAGVDATTCTRRSLQLVRQTVSGVTIDPATRTFAALQGPFLKDVSKEVNAFDWGSAAYSWDEGSYHFIMVHNSLGMVLDINSHNVAGPVIATTARDFLAKEIAKGVAAGRKNVIFMHDPFEQLDVSKDAQFLSLLNGGGVVAIFCGHVHQNQGFITSIGGVPVFRSGSSEWFTSLVAVFGEDKLVVQPFNSSTKAFALGGSTINLSNSERMSPVACAACACPERRAPEPHHRRAAPSARARVLLVQSAARWSGATSARCPPPARATGPARATSARRPACPASPSPRAACAGARAARPRGRKRASASATSESCDGWRSAVAVRSAATQRQPAMHSSFAGSAPRSSPTASARCAGKCAPRASPPWAPSAGAWTLCFCRAVAWLCGCRSVLTTSLPLTLLLCALDFPYQPCSKSSCAPDEELQDGLCYKKCKLGFVGGGPVCYSTCPAGYKGEAQSCVLTLQAKHDTPRTALPDPTVRPSWHHLLPAADDGALCRLDAHIFGKGCCCTLFTRSCCDSCPAGYKDDGCTCRRDVVITGEAWQPFVPVLLRATMRCRISQPLPAPRARDRSQAVVRPWRGHRAQDPDPHPVEPAARRRHPAACVVQPGQLRAARVSPCLRAC